MRGKKPVHGHARKKAASREYKSWMHMKYRCMNPNSESYAEYGGRGITVCDEWLDFKNFLRDMGPRPPGHTLDRRDVNGPYTKENCKWSSSYEQSQNRRIARRIEFQGETKNLSEWCRLLKLTRRHFYRSLDRGETEQEILLKAQVRASHKTEAAS